jgi:hypothetical protein
MQYTRSHPTPRFRVILPSVFDSITYALMVTCNSRHAPSVHRSAVLTTASEYREEQVVSFKQGIRRLHMDMNTAHSDDMKSTTARKYARSWPREGDQLERLTHANDTVNYLAELIAHLQFHACISVIIQSAISVSTITFIVDMGHSPLAQTFFKREHNIFLHSNESNFHSHPF